MSKISCKSLKTSKLQAKKITRHQAIQGYTRANTHAHTRHYASRTCTRARAPACVSRQKAWGLTHTRTRRHAILGTRDKQARDNPAKRVGVITRD